MPIAQAFLLRLGGAWASFGPLGRAGLILLVLVAVPFYLVLGPLWFDLAWLILSTFAGARLSVRGRRVMSIGVAAAIVIVILGSAAAPRRASSEWIDLVARASSSEPADGAGASGGAGPGATSGQSDLQSAILPAATSSAAPTASAAAATPAASLPTVAVLPGEPNPVLTPGSINPAVTQATIGSTICVTGWTATIRPGESYTSSLKIRQIALYGYSDTSTSSYEEDHLIALELGGNPIDPANLWPQPLHAFLADGRPSGAGTKDSYENLLHGKVCAGTMSLADAQQDIGIHWVHYYYGIALAAGSNPTPGGSRTSTTPSPGTLPPGQTLSVSIASLPSSVPAGSSATVSARTLPGASCTAWVTYASGTISGAPGLAGAQTAGSSGVVTWTWNIGSTTRTGIATATVACTLGDQTVSDSRTFEVT